MSQESNDGVRDLAKRVQSMDDYNLGILTQVVLFETAIRFPKDFMKNIKSAIDNVLKNREFTDRKSLERIEDQFE